MSGMAAIRRFAAGDAPAVTAIIRGLPNYFTGDVPAKAGRDAGDHEAWIVTDSGTVTGFAIAYSVALSIPLGWPIVSRAGRSTGPSGLNRKVSYATQKKSRSQRDIAGSDL